MTWRRVPPAYSPIAWSSVARAVGAAAGVVDPTHEEISRALNTTFGGIKTVLTDSGTSALVLALRAAVPAESVVALPGYGCIDLIAAAIRARVRVILYDLDPETLGPDLDSVRTCLRAGARALIVAPLYGYPMTMPVLSDIAQQAGVALIEDAAQSASAQLGGRRVGAFGDLTVLSFGRGKGTTCGGGGALVVRRPLYVEHVSASLARRRGAKEITALAALGVLARPSLYSLPASIPMLKLGEMVYHEALEPRSLADSAAAALKIALAADDGEVAVRRRNAAVLDAGVRESASVAAVRPVPSATPGYLRFAVMARSRSVVPSTSLGISRGYPIALDEHERTQGVLAKPAGALAGARTLRDGLLTLPTHSRVAAGDLIRLREWLVGEKHPPGLRATEVS